jgi:hypothetical protein
MYFANTIIDISSKKELRMIRNYSKLCLSFRINVVLLLLGFAVIFLVSCAVKKDWGKAGTTTDQIERDKIKCTREFLTPGAGGAVRNKTVDRNCMKSLGYKLE